ncbi:MAG: bifunctional hydroxymethylpyrimidine kinase/phosphomethylpyrimidine kinase [Candidatus Omnitrophica bacterium CG11_big_fil_rev_8_21_14_0_20_45_26]|uniref:hydroxymethylpyrimidine kinase n=1 Tax=Candidatus Abzuiibacterium crystallinum TaxID=1974748 RepID=A0A2H0LKU8_9BACT|nr:MAG: bifunctional hydroxymethylpyrimidine kinase/phosphomethylpyrimidine kinase [Candidatus Omnitrophica bacterium CG11_big_fil_rev_8_21_14_0_20_45_26]PIW63956.1 MAG: bifunctional hydroxymethylpyrimidine kinase/phosphomethylpyrimidine kinase [Candidatus Omnitrophica bacterium CG12_big_fil_rev_8_21_14_0_65_45_16]
MMTPIALTIAGSDPSGGAGIQADLKTFHQRHVYGMSVITLITAQNTLGVKEVFVLDSKQVAKQLDAVLEDIVPHAVKLGALGNQANLEVIAKRLRTGKFSLIIDPVLKSHDSRSLLDPQAIDYLKKEILSLATVLMPNLDEASILTGESVKDIHGMEKAARALHQMGAQSVLVKGGHLIDDATDLLFHRGKVEVFSSQKIKTQHTHGTGCTFSACLTAELAKGNDLVAAVRLAKTFVTEAIRTSPGLGKGSGSLNHRVKI